MKILFQGDSITDAGRDRENNRDMGPGYPKYASELIREEYPDVDFDFINLGISGDQTKDLMVRWREDCINLQPDIVSILIGVNDTWHNAEAKTWVTAPVFEANYRYLLEWIRRDTNAKILILEPFLLPVPDKQIFHPDIDEKILIARKLAREYAAAFVPLDGLFAAACVETDMYHWSDDGVHPNENGSRFIGSLYAEAIYPIIEDVLAGK